MVMSCYSSIIVQKRPLFIVLIVIALLVRSAAGFAMQFNIADGTKQASGQPSSQAPHQSVNQASQASQALMALPSQHPCHSTSDRSMVSVDDASGAGALQDCHGQCGQCCMTAALPSQFTFDLPLAQHAAPSALLFNNLPAIAQRPSKPPLV